MGEEKITLSEVLAELEKKLYRWPATKPLSDAEQNERALVLERQKQELLARNTGKSASATPLEHEEALEKRLKFLEQQKKMLLAKSQENQKK